MISLLRCLAPGPEGFPQEVAIKLATLSAANVPVSAYGRTRSRVSSREKCWSDWRLLLSDTPPNQQQQQQLSIGQGLKAMCICSFSLSNYNNSNNDREFKSVSSNSELVPPLTWTSFQKATTLSLCYLVGGELCRTPELQALCRLLYISGICISLDLSRYAHDYAASILQKTSFLNKDRVQRNRDVIYKGGVRKIKMEI